MTETGITTQKQGKASDYKSVDCKDSDDNREHRGRVLAAVVGYYQSQRRGKRHTRRQTGTEAARHKSNGIRRYSGRLQGSHAAGSTQRAATQPHRHRDGVIEAVRTYVKGKRKNTKAPRPPKFIETPRTFLSDIIKTQVSSYLPTGVKPL